MELHRQDVQRRLREAVGDALVIRCRGILIQLLFKVLEDVLGREEGPREGSPRPLTKFGADAEPMLQIRLSIFGRKASQTRLLP